MTIYRDQLEAVYKLIEKPENWLQDKLCTDADDKPVSPYSAAAVRFCLIGALDKACPLPGGGSCGAETQTEFERALGVRQAHHFNDRHTHAEVLALLQSAIERAPVRP